MLRLPFCTHRFTLTGLNLERFMNIMHKSGIELLSARRVDNRTLEGECYSADLSSVRKLVDEKGWRLQSTMPQGFSAFLAAMRRRPGIPIGALLALCMVIVLMQFVWRVELHNAGAYQADIAAYLREEGYGPGTPKARVSAAELERKLTRRYPAMAWFHAYVYNVTLVVDCTPGVPMPKLTPAKPSDVVAAHGGVVTSIRVFAGTAQVRAGDLVQKGQVLIRGVERAQDEQLTPVPARGVVMARCWRSHTVRLPLYDVQSVETGRFLTHTQLCTPWFHMPSTLETPDFLAYNTYVSLAPVVGSFFPVFQKTVEQREVAMSRTPRAESEVRKEAAAAAFRGLKTALRGYEIVDKWVDYCMIEDVTLAATATAEWLMDIGGAPP
ncbi:MAG: sporulation protein YqfD [Clostridia bacterium]